MRRRVLLLLPHFLHDPSSDAARSMRAICELLAAQDDRFEVRALSPSVGIDSPMTNPRVLLAARGVRVATDTRGAVGRGRPALQYSAGGIRCTVLDTPVQTNQHWEYRHGEQYNRLYERMLETFEPDVVFCTGGAPGDIFRRELAHLANARVIMAVHSLGYMHKLAFEHVDDVLFPSKVLLHRYEETIGISATAIPTPVSPVRAATIMPERSPHSVLVLRPAPGRVLAMVMAIAKGLAGRSSPVKLCIEADHAELQLFRLFLQRHAGTAGLSSIGPLSEIRYGSESLARTASTILCPSTDESDLGLDAAEAMTGGIIPVVSDRGSLPEVVLGQGPAADRGGIVIPMVARRSQDLAELPTPNETRPWIEALERLASNPAERAERAANVRALIEVRAPHHLAEALCSFFERSARTAGLFAAATPATR